MGIELIVIDPQQLHYENELLKLTVLGGIRLEGLDRLRVTLKVEVKGSPRSEKWSNSQKKHRNSNQPYLGI